MTPPKEINSFDRARLIEAVPTFMNQCEGGACQCTGDDVKLPDPFELAALAALDAVRNIYSAPHHYSQKRAALRIIQTDIDERLRTL